MSKEAWLNLVTSTFALRVIPRLDGVLQHRSHYGNRAFMTTIAEQDRLLKRHEGGANNEAGQSDLRERGTGHDKGDRDGFSEMSLIISRGRGMGPDMEVF